MCCTGYTVVAEQRRDLTLGEYTTYGIRLERSRGQAGQTLCDISTDRAFVEAMAQLFNRFRLSAIHFEDMVSDFLADPSALEAALASGDWEYTA